MFQVHLFPYMVVHMYPLGFLVVPHISLSTCVTGFLSPFFSSNKPVTVIGSVCKFTQCVSAFYKSMQISRNKKDDLVVISYPTVIWNQWHALVSTINTMTEAPWNVHKISNPAYVSQSIFSFYFTMLSSLLKFISRIINSMFNI